MIIQSSIPVNVNELFCRRRLKERVVVISWSKNYVFLMSSSKNVNTIKEEIIKEMKK